MADNKNKITVTFAPGVLEELESQMTPEELQQFLDAVTELQNSGDIEQAFEDAPPVDMKQLEKDDPEMYKILRDQLDGNFDIDTEPNTIH